MRAKDGESVGSSPVDVPLDYRPRPCADVLELDMDDGVILFNRSLNLVHNLNPSAATVWKACDGKRTVRDIVRLLARAYRLKEADAITQIASVIGEFDALGLTEDPATPAAPDSTE